MDYAQHKESLPKDLRRASLAHLVVGQGLFLSDPRRTPVEIVSQEQETASFSVRVSDFEDAGAIWILPFWEISKFLIPSDAQELTIGQRTDLEDGCAKFNRTMELPVHAANFTNAQNEIAAQQQEVSSWLVRNFPDLPTEQSKLTAGTQTCEHWNAAFQSLLASKGLDATERDFATQYVSNPNASEMIKGHRIMLAEMGLVPYQGHIVRDGRTFEGNGQKAKRRAHIVIRLAFMRAMLSALHLTSVPLYRVIYSDTALTAPRNTGFVSSTFSAQVAEALFRSGQKTKFAATYWQYVPADRLFMSFFETPELSRQFQEAEAVLLFEQSNEVF